MPSPTPTDPPPPSPWRPIFEDVRRSVGHQRDAHGVLGSINCLRHQMEARGANPNVVRNIIYRDKGRLPDKQALYAILDDLWRSRGKPPLRAPELEALLSPGSGQDQEVLQLLGREKRRAYRTFVQAVRKGGDPKLVVVGRPGSGKTLLSDYIQQALELDPPAADRLIRLEFSGTDLATSLGRLGAAVGVAPGVMEAKLVKVGSSSAFAVQADAQADVARAVLDAARQYPGLQVLLLHVSQSLGGQESLGMSPLRLNVPEVPRVSAADWLWASLFEPLSRLPRIALLVSMADLPARAHQRLGVFDGPVRLTPPTAAEARRFVRARLPHATPAQHDEILQRAGRSFEELRTLTLLAEIRDPAADHVLASERSVTQLAKLVDAGGDTHLRNFLSVVAVLSLPEYPAFGRDELAGLREAGDDEEADLEGAFLDAVPGRAGTVRCFSRELARALRTRLADGHLDDYRRLHRRAADQLAAVAEGGPHGETAARYLTFLFEGRDWAGLTAWMARHSVPQALVRRMWAAATQELPEGPPLERFAQQVAAHYVKLGTFQHPDVRDAFAVMAASSNVELRVWTSLRRAEGLSLLGHHDQAEALLVALPDTRDPLLLADAAVARAGVERWRGRSTAAAALVFEAAPRHLRLAPRGAETDAVRVKASLWAGLLAKDQGELEAALAHFDSVPRADDLDASRVAFQRGDVFMRLGHFDHALAAMDEAVTLAHRSAALVTEQTRYLARRATVHRRRGDLVRAAEDFQVAREVLLSAHGVPGQRREPADDAERDYWLARVEDEAGLLLLASGRFDDAALGFERDLRRFQRYAAFHGVDASYRVMRSTLRLALAYGCRGLGQPFRRPFAITSALEGSNPDLRQARVLIAEVIRHVEADTPGMGLGSLARDGLLAANLFAATGTEALAHAESALARSRYPFQRAQAHAHAAAAALRLPDPIQAEAHVQAGHRDLAASLAGAGGGERGDLELCAWLIALDAAAAVARDDAAVAAQRLARGLGRPELRPYHDALLRQFGEAVEARGMASWARTGALATLLKLEGPLEVGPLRLADALAAHWARLADAAPAAPAGHGAAEGASGTEVRR
jgi:tetratricopeptide (TPR) repeat protein